VFADMPMSEMTLIMLNCGRLSGYAPVLPTVGRTCGFRPLSNSATKATSLRCFGGNYYVKGVHLPSGTDVIFRMN
jgi:hypothetical protein